MKVTIEVYIEKEEFGYRATIGLNSAFGATINEALHRAVDQAFPLSLEKHRERSS
ncbi:MAG: hypothetical protein ACTSPB_01275 [Candidatus Thorarchaeota archaeon]